MVGPTLRETKLPQNNDNELCGVCSDNVEQDTKADACDDCKRWYHQTCGKISNALYNKIYNAPQNNPVSWQCKNCRPENKRDTSRNNKPGKLNLDDRNHLNNTLTDTAHILASKKDHNSSQDCDSTLIQDLLSRLEKTEAKNVELQNVVDLLSADRKMISDQLDRTNSEILNLNEALQKKKNNN